MSSDSDDAPRARNNQTRRLYTVKAKCGKKRVQRECDDVQQEGGGGNAYRVSRRVNSQEA
jgi:hypothetical protein